MIDFLEPKIKILVEALTSWEGVRTYSSCEGHDSQGSGPGPYVTFSCDNQKMLRAISKKLVGTSWKIVLDDVAISKNDIHYTLRYVFEDLYETLSIETMQAEIPRIAALVKSETPDKPKAIENLFPVLRCPECNANSFLLNANMMLNLGYEPETLTPKLLIYSRSSGKICCEKCASEIDFENPLDEIMGLITRTYVRGKVLRRINQEGHKK